MSQIVERSGLVGVDDTGEIVIPDDFEGGRQFPANASRIQGAENLRQYGREQELVDDYDEQEKLAARTQRENRVSEAALENVGVFVSFEQYKRDVVGLVNLVALDSQYRGLKKGGRKTRDFRRRYEYPDEVADGAEKNHGNLRFESVPRVYHSAELVQSGFDERDVKDQETLMWMKAKQVFGGKANEGLRAQIRKRNG